MGQTVYELYSLIILTHQEANKKFPWIILTHQKANKKFPWIILTHQKANKKILPHGNGYLHVTLV